MTKKTADNVPTWVVLNDSLRDCTEKFAVTLLEKAKQQKWPSEYAIRIQKRFNKLRRAREIKELQSVK